MRYPYYCRQVCTAAATADQASTETANSATLQAPKSSVGTPTSATAAAAAAAARTSASVFREYEVEVRPEPPPPPAAPDGRSAEDTLMAKMGLGGEGVFAVSPSRDPSAIEAATKE